MGVPVVTKPGPTFAGRHSTTHLINAGLEEFVTDTWDSYAQKVVELANDLERLSELRNELRDQVKNRLCMMANDLVRTCHLHLEPFGTSGWMGMKTENQKWQSHIDVEAAG